MSADEPIRGRALVVAVKARRVRARTRAGVRVKIDVGARMQLR